jgi:hypothetical protein
MYLRHSVRRKDGKTHTYWRLVRSVRRNGKVIQETVAQLGELDAQGRAKAKALARAFMGQADQRELFEDSTRAEKPVAVRLDRVRLGRGRSFGDVWLGWMLWQALKLDELCEKLLPVGRASVPWSLMATVLVVARLCRPSSELYIAENSYRRTAREDLLGLSHERVNDDRLYRALDRLLPHKRAIERHLVERLGELFALEYDLLLYDVTSTYFEGLAEGNALAQRGYSRDRRPDCKQVCIALVVTRAGMPLGYEIFPGNRTDVTTVEEIVETMESRYGLAERVWVMDRGMASTDNIGWLQGSGRRYLIGTPRSEVRKWSQQIAEASDWREVRDGVEVKLCPGPDGKETFLLCRSVERREVEAHIMVCFLAYVLWKTLEQWQRRAGLGNSPRVTLEELGQIQSADVILPLVDHPGRELRIRCVVRPERTQATLLDRLGLMLPERLRIPAKMAQM